jgi:hypothetical protein
MVARQRDEHQPGVAEQIALARDRVEALRVLEFDREVTDLLGPRCARGVELLGVTDDGRPGEEGVAAAMIGMQVGAHHHVDVGGADPDIGQALDHVGLRADRRHDLGEPAPARGCIHRDRRVAAGVEQHIALAVADQVARHRHLDRLVAGRIGKVDAPLQAQASGRQSVHLHGVTPESGGGDG